MIKRFIYELIIGIAGLIAVFIYGESGLAVMALLAFHPFIGKRKLDEREKQLFNKSGRITAGGLLLILTILYYGAQISINGQNIGDFWLILAAFSFLTIHGLTGLIVYRLG